MLENVHIVIPARLNSTRLPRKLLMSLGGQTVIERVYYQALKVNAASVKIATDSEEIYEHVKTFAQVEMTGAHHQSGTDRVAEVIAKGQYPGDAVIVNVQGDEPFIEPNLIAQVAKAVLTSGTSMATLCWPITDEKSFQNPNVVKVVRDQHDFALYFSRATIPYNRDSQSMPLQAYRHIGLYAYRAHFLLNLVKTPPCEIENIEALEQLRVLWMGEKILVPIACEAPKQDINTLEDLEWARMQYGQ